MADDKIAISAKDAKKFLRSHGFSDNMCVRQFLSKVHSNVTAGGRTGRIKIPDGILWGHGIKTKLYAEVSSAGVLTAIKQ